MEATSKELRLHTKELLSATGRGEEVIITVRGKPMAKLVPLAEDADIVRPQRNPGFAMWRDAEEDVDDYVRRLRQGRNF